MIVLICPSKALGFQLLTGPFSRATSATTGLSSKSLIVWISMIALSTNAPPVSRWQSSQ